MLVDSREEEAEGEAGPSGKGKGEGTHEIERAVDLVELCAENGGEEVGHDVRLVVATILEMLFAR